MHLWTTCSLFCQSTERRKHDKRICRKTAEILEIRPAGQAQHIFTHIIWKMNGYDICLKQPLGWEGLQFWEPKEMLERAALPAAFRHYTALVRQAAEKEREE